MNTNKDCVQNINGRLHFVKELINEYARFDAADKQMVDKQFESIKEYLHNIWLNESKK